MGHLARMQILPYLRPWMGIGTDIRHYLHHSVKHMTSVLPSVSFWILDLTACLKQIIMLNLEKEFRNVYF